jgi:cytochrome bd-type quinol oxidase subunit 2
MKMISQQTDLGDPVTLLLMIIAIILVALILYIGARLIAGKKETDTGYIIRLLLIAFIIVILVAVVIGAIVRTVDPIPYVNTAAAQLVPVLIYLAIVFLVKYILIPEMAETTKWNASIWIALISLFLIFLINAIGLEFFPDQPLIDAGI